MPVWKSRSPASMPILNNWSQTSCKDVIRGLECRADNFILKPYDESHLLSRVKFVLVNRAVRQSEQTGMGVEIFFNGHKHFTSPSLKNCEAWPRGPTRFAASSRLR